MRLLTILVLMGVSLVAQADKLSTEEQKTLLNDIDNICADTWCGGDYNFKFKRIQCLDNESFCLLELTAKPYGSEAHEEFFTCWLKDLDSKADIIDASSRFSSYTDKVYDEVTSCINTVIYPTLQGPQSYHDNDNLDAESCLAVAEKNPNATNRFADFFYDSTSNEYFATRFFYETQDKLAAETGCRKILPQTLQMTCTDVTGGYPVCAARIKQDDEPTSTRVGEQSIAIVKDYVDSARLVVIEKNNDQRVLPQSKEQNDEALLYLPNPGACYFSLLESSFDSSAYKIDVSDFLVRDNDGQLLENTEGEQRFVLAQTLRRLVQDKVNPESNCQYEQIDVAAREVPCAYIGNSGVNLCSIEQGDGGYFIYLSNRRSSNVVTVFNRFD